jgi:hypothetical protein
MSINIICGAPNYVAGVASYYDLADRNGTEAKLVNSRVIRKLNLSWLLLREICFGEMVIFSANV